MCIKVNFQVNLLLERFTTQMADERSEVSVGSHMRVKVGGAVEGFITCWTDIRLDCGVCQFVSSEISRLSEGSATRVTFKRLFSCVNPL